MRINAMNRTLLLIITTIAIIACGCTRQQPSDPRLQRLTLSVDTGPQAAIDSLAAIDPATLGDFDRHYYNFLTVKARDKAYIVHTSDSLILDVINHFGLSPKMAEALYYAGRVYSDLGDYPTALRYFHDALDRISDDPEDNNILRASIASQTARLMLNLRMYSKALPFAETALKCSLNTGDSICSIYDRTLIGNIMVRTGNFGEAEKHYIKALNVARNTSTKDTIEALSELGTLQYESHNYQKSYEILSKLHDQAEVNEVNYILAYLAKSCLKLHRGEDAAQYAKEMLQTGSENNLRIAYYILVQPEVRQYLDPDSIDYYFDKYLEITESHYNAHEQQSAIIQASMYDYSLHERMRQQAENKKRTLSIILAVTISALMGAFGMIMYLRYRYQKSKTDLLDVNYRLNLLNKACSIKSSNTHHAGDTSQSEDNINDDQEITEYRNELNEYIRSLDQLSKKRYSIPESILCSEVYAKLKNAISQNKTLNDNDPIWDELHELIKKVSPDFDKKIRTLSSGRITIEELHTIFLIKAGVRPSDQCKLFGRHASTITFRRTSIGKKIMCGKLNPSLVDTLIQNL